MAVSVFKMVGFFVGFFLIVGLVSSAKFDELFQPSWALDHFAYEGELLRLKLDNYSVSVAAVDNAKKCSSSGEKRYCWDEPTLSELNAHQSHQLLWVKANHMVYDYCSDTARFPVTPLECLHHSHRHH
ncbi:hypothetical protein D5086_033899 [Populus alba]|uniref:Uncharacterized protein n=1 Tax=Populus alba TaxID=43335 RepID=A0ACC4AI54_POPAL